MPCKICGDPATIRSHLMPKAFVKAIRGGKQQALSGSIDVAGQKVTQGGEFDDDLLCHQHEDHLKHYDDYAVRWVRRFAKEASVSEEDPSFYLAPNNKPHLLLGFVASVIWRNAVSARNSTYNMDLGAYEAKLRQLVFGQSSYNPAMAVIKQDYLLDDEIIVPDMIFQPAPDTTFGKRGWTFEVGGFAWSLKLDARTKGAIPRQFQANGRNPVPVFNKAPMKIIHRAGFIDIFRNMTLPREYKPPES